MSNPTPAITFSVDLTPTYNITVGPITNEITTALLPPGDVDNRANVVSTWLPTLQIDPNFQLKHGDTFTAYGQKAVYLRSMYAVGYAPAERAYLTVVSVE